MVATSDKTLLEQNTITLNGSGKRVLRNINIYGANGSGKSNLFKVFYYTEDLFTKCHQEYWSRLQDTYQTFLVVY